MDKTQDSQDNEFIEITIGPDEPVFTSGVVCKLLGIPVWVLKQLDGAGIVSPPRSNTLKARLYSKRELKKVEHCWYYIKEKKVKVPGLRVILELEERYGEL